LRIPSIEESCEVAVCWAMVCPAVFSVCDELFELFWIFLPISFIACSTVLATPMLALM